MTSPTFLQDLGSDVVWGTTECCPSDGVHVITSHQKGSQSEIADLGVHVPVKEDVAHFEVAMNDAFAVHILDSASNLHCEKAHFGFRQALPPLHQVH